MAAVEQPPRPRIAYAGDKGNIFTATTHNGHPQPSTQLTWSWDVPPQEGETASNPLTYVWPSWAPDGNQIACFGLRGTPGPDVQTSVYAIAADGIESWELASISGGMPIYGNWSPQADAFAALIQRGESALSLEIVSLDQPGQMTPLLSGAPLFWSWSPRGDKLAVHVGGSRRDSAQARVVLIDAGSGQIERTISDRPGHFRVPSWSPQENLLAYVEQEEDGNQTLRLLDVNSGETGPVASLSGSVAALWSADGQALAFGTTARPSSLLLTSIQVLDLTTGQISPLQSESNPADESTTGFFWSPRGDALFTLSVDVQHSHLRWQRIERTSGQTTEIVRFLPSREQTLFFSFFDQYALSHPPIAPDGSALAFAGHQIGPVALDISSPTQVYIAQLDQPEAGRSTQAVRSIGSGNFVCWGST
jgi:hypothetical protein